MTSLAINTKGVTGIKQASIQSPAPSSDQIVGNYRLGKTIGQGTYGKVKIASDIRTGQKVAVKLLEKASIQSEKQIARIQREIRFLKLLHHPHIVKVYDVLENNEMIFIVMEYATGGELFGYIVAHKKVKEKEARSFFRQVISALDYCHRSAVIHRDLKPENLLLDANKLIKIIDFGFGNTYKSDGLLDTFCGSPFYAAPEMILGKRYEGPEVDMWSLGVILFALLCGHLPFDDDNTKELYRKIASGTYTIPDYVPADCKFLIRRMITVDPKKRATLDEIKNHRWVCEGYEGPPDNLIPERPVYQGKDLNENYLERLASFGYQPDEVRKAFDEYAAQMAQIQQFSGTDKPPVKLKINPSVTIYYLFSEMVVREKERNNEVPKEESGPVAPQRKASLQSPVSAPAARTVNPPAPQDSKKDLFAIHEEHGDRNTINDADRTLVREEEDGQTPEPIPQLQAPRNNKVTTSMPTGLNQTQATVPKIQTGVSNQYKIAPVPVYQSMMQLSAGSERERTSSTPAAPASHRTTRTDAVQPAPQPNSALTSPANAEQQDEQHSRRLSMPNFNPVRNLFGGPKSPQARIPEHGAVPAQTQSNPSTPSNVRPTRHSVSGASTGHNSSPASAEIRSISGWFMNVSTTSSKTPIELMNEVHRVLNELSEFGVRFERDRMAPWVLVVEVQPKLLKTAPQIITASVQPLVPGSPQSEHKTPMTPSSQHKQSPLREISAVRAVESDENLEEEMDEGELSSEDITESMTHMDVSPMISNVVAQKAPVPPPKQNQAGTPLAKQSTSLGSTRNLGGEFVTFQIEICKVPRLNMYGLHFKRLSGGVWNYKKVCGRLLSVMNL